MNDPYSHAPRLDRIGIFRTAVNPLRYAVPAARKPWVAIALRSPCFAQAQGGHPWPPVGRMRPTHGHPRAACVAPLGAAGKTCDAFAVPASLQARVRHCATQSLLRASPGWPSVATRRTHASYPWRTRSAHAPSPVFHAPEIPIRSSLFPAFLSFMNSPGLGPRLWRLRLWRPRPK